MDTSGEESPRRFLKAQALGTNGDESVGADAGLGTLAEDVGPSGALGGGCAQDEATFFFGKFQAAWGVNRISRWISWRLRCEVAPENRTSG